MAYKTKVEKRAWRKGLFAGLFGRKKKKDAPKVKPKKKRNMKARRSEYIVKTYHDDAIDDLKTVVSSKHRNYEDAFSAAYKQEQYERKLADHSLVSIYSTIEKKNPSRMRASGFRFSKVNPYSEQRDPKLEAKRKEFLRLGGGRSGVYDISKPDVAKFVREYKEFIPKKEIHKRDKHNNLVPVYRTK